MLSKRPLLMLSLLILSIVAVLFIKQNELSPPKRLLDPIIKVTPYQNVSSPESNRESASIERIHYVIQKGDSLSLILEKLSLPLSSLPAILAADVSSLQLDNLAPKKQLEFEVEQPSNKLMKLTYHHSLVERAVYERAQHGEFEYHYVEEMGQWQSHLYAGEINGSFSLAASQLGLTSRQIATISRVLAEKINFARDLRQGDRFEVLVNEQYLDTQLTGNTEIQGIRFYVRGNVVSAFLAKDGRFYDREGNSLEQAFNRYPVAKKYRRITSPFDQHRKHPVTGRITPHNGTDFATPVGSPVYSTGDGQVVAIRNHPYAGKYLVIEHNSIYTTRYLHLSKFLVKVGQKVKRGQEVALSGATGRLTGPHLHFEVLVRNRPVDSMKVNLPMAHAIPKDEKPSFTSLVALFDKKSAQHWGEMLRTSEADVHV